jgi:glucans biosynthesis protein
MVPRTVYLCWFVLAGAQLLAAPAFDFGQVRERARALSQQPFQAVSNAIPSELLNLGYVQSQAIRFKPAHALWATESLPFQIEFFLPGSAHKQTVLIHEVTSQAIRRIPFSSESFDFGTNRMTLPASLDYAGFRIFYQAQDFGEVASFLGASYFRMVGRGETFGASARGLALQTSDLGREEFPVFREFWIGKPGQNAGAISVWALLDSPSVAGAFEFLIKPGVTTVAQVQASLFARRTVREFGIAPLTSMFLHDQNSHVPLSDFRPEVHDSDGLLLHTGEGRFLWRPLESGKMMRVNAYADSSPKGFGFMQRQRLFDQYQDLTARFELRPNVWVEPTGDWGRGAVELVQLPTNLEYTDNVVAFWVPEKPPQPGRSLDLAYQLHWFTNQVLSPSLGHVRATRIGRVPTAAPAQPANIRFVIDFGGSALEALSAREQIDAEVHFGEGTKLVADTVLKNPLNGTWRLVIEITPPAKAVDLQAVLKRHAQPVTETWTYTWQP